MYAVAAGRPVSHAESCAAAATTRRMTSLDENVAEEYLNGERRRLAIYAPNRNAITFVGAYTTC